MIIFDSVARKSLYNYYFSWEDFFTPGLNLICLAVFNTEVHEVSFCRYCKSAAAFRICVNETLQLQITTLVTSDDRTLFALSCTVQAALLTSSYAIRSEAMNTL